jgi:hypothetical protein
MKQNSKAFSSISRDFLQAIHDLPCQLIDGIGLSLRKTASAFSRRNRDQLIFSDLSTGIFLSAFKSPP